MKTSLRTHEGRVALVTDAGQGIGQAIAIDLKPSQETAGKMGPSATALQLDGRHRRE